MHQAAEYQNRRGEEKRIEAERRKQLLSQEPTDITPANKSAHVWSSDKADLDKFEQEWSMKPVSIKGVFDHNRETKVQKIRNGEKGVDIVTPFYTHLDGSGKEQAILVNRGWVPLDLKDQRLHYTSSVIGRISGILYRGDAKNKYSKDSSPQIMQFTSVQPSELALMSQLPNEDEASQFMLHQIDFDESRRQVLPTAPTVNELTTFVNDPERHAAYEMMWRSLAFAGVAANTALWLYF